MPYDDDILRPAPTGALLFKDSLLGRFALNMSQAFLFNAASYFDILPDFDAFYARFITLVSRASGSLLG